MDKWFLVYCKARQEARAEENLIRQGFDVFRPTINIIKSRIGCKNSTVCESLFPRYLFINVDTSVKSIAPVVSTYGVSNFVKFGDKYATASKSLIDEIKSTASMQASIISGREVIQGGDDIYVNGHGFDRVKAIYCNPCGDMRAVILMNILGNETRLSVPVETISKRESAVA